MALHKHKTGHKKKLTQRKAKKILKHGSVRGKRLTKKQVGFFGARASSKRRK